MTEEAGIQQKSSSVVEELSLQLKIFENVEFSEIMCC